MSTLAHDGPSSDSYPREFSWGHSGITLNFSVDADSRISLSSIVPGADHESPRRVLKPTNLIDIRTVADGSNFSSNRSVQTGVGDRLILARRDEATDGDVCRLRLALTDPETGIEAALVLESLEGSGSFSASTVVTNRGEASTTLLAVTSLVVEVSLREEGALDDLELWWARNEWLSEARWEHAAVRSGLLPDVDRAKHPIDSRSSFFVSGLGAWSSSRYLPMGMLEDRHSGLSYAWQIENPGPWRWELAERFDSVYFALLGPTDNEHQWSVRLAPDESFTSAVATVVAVEGTWQEAIGELTRARQITRAAHPSFQTKPVVFNDYMNALMGDPTEEKLMPLVEAAAAAGAEIFCVDAGWFDDGPEYWWDAVGEYEVSPSRFPRGLNVVFDRMRQLGVIPGLWLEPEVVGVKSPVAQRLPDEAFFMRDGERLREHTRFHLDLRHSAARAHLDGIVDRLVNDLGVGYLKLDYNINPGPGTDVGGVSAGAGLMGHGRAYLDWLDGIVERHPDLMIMNCASGGMRMDAATVRHTHVQQVTDQQNFLTYVPIAVAAPTAVSFDQAAAWTYPDHMMSQDEVEFCLVAPMLQRFELSGQLDRLSASQLEAVKSAVAVYKEVRHRVVGAEPRWPLGLPGWTDEWFSFALRTERETLLSVWRRSGAGDSQVIELPWLAGAGVTPRIEYPANSSAELDWNDVTGALSVRLERTPTSVFVSLR